MTRTCHGSIQCNIVQKNKQLESKGDLVEITKNSRKYYYTRCMAPVYKNNVCSLHFVSQTPLWKDIIHAPRCRVLSVSTAHTNEEEDGDEDEEEEAEAEAEAEEEEEEEEESICTRPCVPVPYDWEKNKPYTDIPYKERNDIYMNDCIYVDIQSLYAYKLDSDGVGDYMGKFQYCQEGESEYLINDKLVRWVHDKTK